MHPIATTPLDSSNTIPAQGDGRTFDFKMNNSRAIEITEKVLCVLDETHFVGADNTEEVETKNYPSLSGISDKDLRMLIARGWLHAEASGGPNPNPRISGSVLYRILGPGSFWLHMKQIELTVQIAKQANNKAWMAIRIAVGSDPLNDQRYLWKTRWK